MKMGIVKHTLRIALVLVPFAATGAESLYVQSTKAKMMDQPSFSAKVVKEIEKGGKVDVQQKKERWVLVSHGKNSGWIASLLLSTQKPAEKITVLGDSGSAVSDNARRRASAVITAGATRGLTADDRRRADEEGAANYVALRWVENISVTDEQMARFESEAVK